MFPGVSPRKLFNLTTIGHSNTKWSSQTTTADPKNSGKSPQLFRSNNYIIKNIMESFSTFQKKTMQSDFYIYIYLYIFKKQDVDGTVVNFL